MSEAFIRIANMSITASWLVLAVIAVRFLFQKTPKWILCLLWALVAIRLICPVSIESSFSLIPNTQPLGQEIVFTAETEKPANGEILDAEGTVLYEQHEPAANGEILDSEGNVIYKQNPERYDSRTRKQMLLNVLSGIWLAGVGLMFLYTLASYWLLRRKVSMAIAIRKGIYQCDFVDSPFVLGLIHPVIYLPFGMENQDMAYVIAHEQAHIRRFDHWWKPLGFLLLTIHWFNPIMWVAYILLCRDIELACDEKVIEKLGSEQRADYTQALVTCSIKRRSITACPLAFGEVGVKERVKSIMNYRKPKFWFLVLAMLACVGIAVCFLTDPIEADVAQDPTEPDAMHQTSFLYDTEESYYLLIGADGVNEIQISLPNSSGGVVNADGSSFKRGEKVYLEPLQGVTDLRGLSITALGENGEVLYGLSIPEDASMEEAINTVGSDGWLLAPTEHIVGPTMEELTDQLHELQELESSTTETVESTYEIYNVAPLEELPDTYTLEEATIDKCVMVFDGEIRDNADVWQKFCVQTSKGQSATVRIVHYYHGTDSSPAAKFIFDLTYGGKIYELRWFEDGKEYIEQYQYLRYFDGLAENENAEYDAYKSYILTNDGKATRQELFLSYASSAYGAAIPHFEVFADYIVYPDYPAIPAELVNAELYKFDSLQKPLYVYQEENMLAQLQSLLANAQGLGFEPKTYDLYCYLVLTGADGSSITLGMDAMHDLFVIDGAFFDYGPGYDDNGSLDATDELLNLLGLQEWPEYTLP